VKYLQASPELPIKFITVIHQSEGWVVKLKMSSLLNPQQHGDFRAFMHELGVPYSPPMRLAHVLSSLETGQSPVDVMYRYQVAVVSHGNPDKSAIEAFRHHLMIGLGYCPETLA
jgi:hypothetical protein